MPFDTSIRDRAIEQRRERLERERRRLIYAVAQALRENQEKYDIREAYITGSLLYSRRWDQLSDVDVAVAGCSQHVFSIMKILEDATEKAVDVIDLDNIPTPDQWRRKGMKVWG